MAKWTYKVWQNGTAGNGGVYDETGKAVACQVNRVNGPKVARVPQLLVVIEAAIPAAEWLCGARPGTDQYERGMALQKAIDEATKGA